jgi:hypothetical protein
MKTVKIIFTGHEQANAFMLWFTEDGGLEAFENSKWAKIANMFNLEIGSNTDIQENIIEVY